jgi:IS1 family transposase
MTVAQFERMFPGEDECIAYLVSHRWPDGVHCPRCGSARAFAMTAMAWKWQCYDCETKPGAGYRFSHLTGTIFENTNKPLREWFRVIHLMLTSKKGVSALQVQRYMGFGSYETAWSMCHRVRAGLADEKFQQLMGIVEMAEAFIGGDDRNRHANKKHRKVGRGTNKEIVIGAVERKGNVVARVIQRADYETIRGFVREAISNKVSLICTDKYGPYDRLKREFFHRAVDHSRGEYVVGAVHTQTIEGFSSLIKRRMVGTFHKVSAKYLPLYVAEFEFRYNNRLNEDIFEAAINAC